ncbi:NfeD family protein [Candidatus Albibeggiatoa sp. nov. NOAA]|uniref:NfeD family protein n=1 Tax=Candidatus Albibeggiatoa sp. nov. NOAA TaxID=3162724 RepID=UPI00330298CE|nr:hypothetical protein [Thiotrichaceae bacterium]
MLLAITQIHRLADIFHSKAKEIQKPQTEVIKKVAKVTKSIKGPYLRGRVKFKDRYFHAFCQDDMTLPRGENVEIVEERGTSLIVKRLAPPPV